MSKKKANRSRISHKDIKLTMHSKLRAEERVGLTSSEEIRKLAVAARYKGININALNVDNYEDMGISKDIYHTLKHYFPRKSNTERFYYYKGRVFIFCGGDSRTLKTIVNINVDNVNKEAV